ncbi:MAG: DUF177 domain-containing protein [Gemmatimonadales bacterium]
MLQIDLGALRNGPVDMEQAVPTDDPCFSDLDVQLAEPVRLSGRLMEAGSGCFFWHGSLHTQVMGFCRRCLEPVEVVVDQQLDVLFTEDQDADDPSAYVIPHRAAELDPGEAVREELILAVPDYVLCDPECRGLCPDCGTNFNESSCNCENNESDPRWAVLEALKLGQPHERT